MLGFNNITLKFSIQINYRPAMRNVAMSISRSKFISHLISEFHLFLLNAIL